jgi:hypothetical protein
VKTRPLFLIALSLAIASGYYFARRWENKPPSPDGVRFHRASEAPQPSPRKEHVSAAADSTEPSMPASRSALLAVMDRVLAALELGPNPVALDELKRALLDGEPRQSIAAILDFLAEGRDAPTGEDFAVGERGTLANAPTLRVLLLDLLGQLARTERSDVAAKVSRNLLESKGSADEWALALRNVAWSDPSAKPYLAGKMREMLAHEPWRTRPTAGMLEAFDVIVYTHDPTLVPDLAEVQRTGSRELQHAAAIALDRLAEQGPLEVMTYLNTHPTELADRPMLRADYYAKADLSQIAQRAALEVYLGRPDVTADEKLKLLKGLATPASFVAENLLTEPPAPDDGAARRDALAKAAADWIAANRFPDLRAPLQQLQERLVP